MEIAFKPPVQTFWKKLAFSNFRHILIEVALSDIHAFSVEETQLVMYYLFNDGEGKNPESANFTRFSNASMPQSFTKIFTKI